MRMFSRVTSFSARECSRTLEVDRQEVGALGGDPFVDLRDKTDDPCNLAYQLNVHS